MHLCTLILYLYNILTISDELYLFIILLYSFNVIVLSFILFYPLNPIGLSIYLFMFNETKTNIKYINLSVAYLLLISNKKIEDSYIKSCVICLSL